MRLRALCLVLFVALCARPVVASPILSIAPSSSSISQGDSFFLDVNIANVSDLFSISVDLTYDATVLTLNDATEGNFLSPAGSTFFFFIPGDPSSVPNVVTLVDLVLGDVPGVTGSGNLARLSFTATGVGNSPIGLLNFSLFNSIPEPISADIAADTQNGSISVAPTLTAVPEPTTVVLLGTGLVVSWRNRRRLMRAPKQ